MAHTWQEQFDAGYSAGVKASIELIELNQDVATHATQRISELQAKIERVDNRLDVSVQQTHEARQWASRLLRLLSLADDATYDPNLLGSPMWEGCGKIYRQARKVLPKSLKVFIARRGQ